MGFTEAEARARLSVLLGSDELFVRGVDIDGESAVSRLKTIIHRTMHATQDAFYYVVRLYARSQLQLLSDLGEALSRVQRLAAERSISDTSVSSSAMGSALTSVEETQFALSSSDRRILTAQAALREAAKSSAYPTGVRGVSVSNSGMPLGKLVSLVESLLSRVVSGVSTFVDAVAAFDEVGFFEDAISHQSILAANMLKRDVQDGRQDLSALDAALLAGLIGARATAIDLSRLKADVSVTPGYASPLIVSGGPLPNVSSAGSATVEVNGGDSLTVSLAGATAPSVVLNSVSNQLVRTEAGTHGTVGNGVLTSFVFSLKPDVVPSSIQLFTVVSSLPVEMRDDGAGTLYEWDGVSLTGPSLGTCNYGTGAMTLSMAPKGAPDSGKYVSASYTFYLLGAGAAYSTFKLFDGNILKSTVVDTASALSTPAAVAAEMSLAGIAIASSADTLTFTSSAVGSGARVGFPAYTTVPVVNAAFGTPKWTTPPTNLNELLLATNIAVEDARGEDVDLSGLSLAGAAAASASVELVDEVLSTTSITYTSGTTLPISGGQIDDVVLFDGGVYSVQSATDSTVTVDREIPKPVDTLETLVSSLVGGALLRRRGFQLVGAPDVYRLNVTAAGAGLSGDNYAAVESLVSASAFESRYTPREGDVLWQGDVEIGSVLSVVGSTLSVSLNGSETQPIASVKVQGLGHKTYLDARPSVRASVEGFSADVMALKTYAHSGSNHAAFQAQVSAIEVLRSTLAAAYALVAGGCVKSVDALVSYLAEEGLTAPHTYLLDLDFASIGTMTSATLSDAGILDELLGELAAAYGADSELETVSSGDTLLEDYTQRPVDELVD
jgi:hypothetical protein